MTETKGFFQKLLRRPTLNLRRSTSTNSSSIINIPINDVGLFEKVWLEIQDTLAEPDEKQILKGITSTPVPARLDALLKALTDEFQRIPEGATGPLLECFLNTEKLHQLVLLSETDRPFGIKAHVLRLTTSLIRTIPYRFLLHSAIHQPVSRHIRSSMSEADLNAQGYLYGAAAASPSLRRGSTLVDGEPKEDAEEELRRLAVRLLVEVCARMKAHPLLLLVFLSDPADPSTRKSLGTDFIFFSCLLRYTNAEGEIGTIARDGLMTLFETIFQDRISITPKIEKPEAEIFTLEDPDEGDTGSADHSINDARSSLATHILEQDLIEVLVSGLGAIYSVLPTKLRLPAETADDIDYEGGTRVTSDSDALFDMHNEEKIPGPDLSHLPCITDEAVQEQLALLADIVDCINHLIFCCEEASPSLPATIQTTGRQLAKTMRDTISTSFVDQVIKPFVSQSSVHDGSSTAIACYLARMVQETSVADGTAMHLAISRLLDDKSNEEDDSFNGFVGLGFLQVIVSKTRDHLDISGY